MEKWARIICSKVAGTIIPNNKLGGGDNTTNIVNVSVDASGSSVAGNSADAQQLGAVIGAAVQAQLIKEKRSGGLLQDNGTFPNFTPIYGSTKTINTKAVVVNLG
ncbi:MAG: hypothetical protein CM15mV115_220 [Caudoviricetes sp.]|nr:MAG: hypothetical protein CM15mV115_220 [Caudoviricetes sp.]